MNPVLLSFADGTTFFVGLGLVVLAVALLATMQRRLVRPILTVCALVGMILVVTSATPLPIWMYAIWLTFAVAGVILSNGFAEFQKLKRSVWASLLIVTVGLVAVEAPYRRAPQLIIPPDATIYVLGDSISAGISAKDRTWPEVLQELSGHLVVNCARAGATVDAAHRQALEITEPNALVILEIGGNDLLGTTTADAYYESLNRLVAGLVDEHQVLLMELPLFPFQNAFGEAQRRVTATHGVELLPKRYFTRVLALPNSTSDGLHLSQAGHDAMAVMLNELLFAD